MTVLSSEMFLRKQNTNEALKLMKQMYQTYCPTWNWSLVENHITHDTTNQAFSNILNMIIKDWFDGDKLQLFLDQYTIYRNNTVAMPLSKIPKDHQPSYEVTYHEIESDPDHEFYDWYGQKFSDDDHIIYKSATAHYAQWNHQQAFEEFSKLLPKHQWFIRVRFNRVVNGIMSLSGSKWKYNVLFRIANGYDTTTRITQKMIKSYDPKKIWNDLELLKSLLKEYKQLKKEFPAYEMRKRNRGLQSSMKHFCELMSEVAYECMMSSLHKKHKDMLL